MTKLLLDARGGDPMAITRVNGWRPISLLREADLVGKASGQLLRFPLLKSARNAKELTIINIERWPLGDDRYTETVDLFRSVNPHVRLGFYSMAPGRAYWETFDGRLKQWIVLNQVVARRRLANGQWHHRGFVDTLDFLCPSLYTPYRDGHHHGVSHRDRWFRDYAPTNIALCRRWQKQIYPFLWPRYFGTKEKTPPLMDADLLRRQVQWCLDACDGVVMWDWTGFDPDNAASAMDLSSRVMEEFT